MRQFLKNSMIKLSTTKNNKLELNKKNLAGGARVNLSIIISNYNTKDITLKCIDSIKKATAF